MIGKGPTVKTVSTTITPVRSNLGSTGAELLGSSKTNNNGNGTNGETSCSEDRVCPTRVSAVPTLIAHKITIPVCQKRQRESYHKCWTCTHRNLSNFHAGVAVTNGVHTNGALKNGTANGIVKNDGIAKNGMHANGTVKNGAAHH